MAKLIVALTKRFDDVEAVAGIDLDIPSGEFFSILGPSGCGKTTTLRLVAGFEQPTSGSILLDGVDVARASAAQAQRQHRLPELRPVPVPDRGRQRGLRPALPEAGQGGVGPPGRGGPRAGPAARLREASARSAVRWPAAAGGPGPGPGPQPVVSCCSTSRSAPSTPSCAGRCRWSSRRCRRRSGSPSSTSPTTRRRHSRCPTAWPSWRRARWPRSGRPVEVYEEPADAYVADFLGRLQPDGRRRRGPDADGAPAGCGWASSTSPPTRGLDRVHRDRSSWPSDPRGCGSSPTRRPAPTACRPWSSGWSSSARPPRSSCDWPTATEIQALFQNHGRPAGLPTGHRRPGVPARRGPPGAPVGGPARGRGPATGRGRGAADPAGGLPRPDGPSRPTPAGPHMPAMQVMRLLAAAAPLAPGHPPVGDAVRWWRRRRTGPA